jgi:hypothetical protein
MFLLATYLVGVCIIKQKYFGASTGDDGKLFELVESNMILATAVIVMHVCGACALCIYTFLMVEGVLKTSDMKTYAVRVVGVAILSEIPYNLAFSGKWFDLSSRNPVFGVLIGLVMLWFYKNFPGFQVANLLYKLAATFGACLWCTILKIDDGICIIIIGLTLWAFQKKPQFQVYAGAIAAILCSIISPFYMIAPVVFLLLHSYNGEKGESNKTLNYISYPVMLIVVTLIGVVAF